MLLSTSIIGFAQSGVTGTITNSEGEILPGVSVTIAGTEQSVVSDSDGRYTIEFSQEEVSLNFAMLGYESQSVTVTKGKIVDIQMSDEKTPYDDVVVYNSYCKHQTLSENVASVSVIDGDKLSHRSARNVANTMFGHGLGLTTLQGRGPYALVNPTFYVRGIKTLSGYSSSPIIMIDGIERSIDDVMSLEVESVTVLKDAAAVALYGYKGTNGVINITTKRGEADTKKVSVSYEHVFQKQFRRPEFVEAWEYATAVNEAKINDGATAYYTAEAIEAYKSGEFPEVFPNVDWQKESLRDWAQANNYNITFSGGSNKFRYYTMLNLNADKGFNKFGDANPDYWTQDMYSRGSIRTNLDIELTPSTNAVLNVFGVLSESRTAGSNFSWVGGSRPTDYAYTSVWDAIYLTPANAFPVQLSNGVWGGATDGSALDGTYNAVALSQDAGYIKNHSRSIFVDFTIDQDFSMFVEGLGASVRLAYDNHAVYVDNYTRRYDYGFYATNGGKNVSMIDGKFEVVGMTPSISQTAEGESLETALSTDAYIIGYNRAVNLFGNIYYDKEISDNQRLYTQLKYDFERRESHGTNQTFFYQNFSAYAHYVLSNRYIADVSLVASAHNFFAPEHKWGFSPTVGLAWIISNEDFLSQSESIDYLKLRATFGRIHSGNTPSNGYWEQTYKGGPSYYCFDTAYTNPGGTTMPNRMATSDDSTHEMADKFNVGIDAKLFNSLDVTLEGFFEKRHNIWVDATNKYSSVLGFDAPYETAGQVNSFGVEASLNYSKTFGDVLVNVGGMFTFNRNEIVEQYEEMKLYDNLKTTGHAVGQIFGMESVGFFKDEADIASSTPQTFTTVRPGDIKYKDVNGDNVIDSNDITAIGHNSLCPEIYYSFNLGAEWKGIGCSIMFQGAANYSAYLNTTSVYLPLIGNTNISREYYENRWTPETAESALYPRLSCESNANNNRYNTTFVQDRSFLKLRNVELYYNFPQNIMEKTKVINGAKVYVRAQDLASFDKLDVVDPEAYGVGYPTTTNIVAGLSLQF